MDQSKKYCKTPFVQVRMARQDLQDHETTCWAFQRKPNIAFLGDFFDFSIIIFLDFTKTLGELFRKKLNIAFLSDFLDFFIIIFWILRKHLLSISEKLNIAFLRILPR